MRPPAPWPYAFLLVVGMATAAGADTVVLEDGRVLENVSVELVPEGTLVVFANGDVLVPDAQLHTHVASDDAKGAARVDARRERSRWRHRSRHEGRHFRYETTLPGPLFELYRDAMEGHLRTLQLALGGKDLPKRGPLVCLFTDRKAFTRTTGARGGVLGYYRHLEPIELAVYDDRVRRVWSLQVARWVTASYAVDRAFPHLDDHSFLQRALADYHGCAAALPEGPRSIVGLVPGGLWETVRQDRLCHTKVDLERVTTGKLDARHAWGWGLVHFLLESKPYAEPFRRFLATAEGKDDEADLRSLAVALGIEAPEARRVFNAAWRAHLDALRPTTAAGFLAAAHTAGRSRDRSRAKAHYEQAIGLPGGRLGGLLGLADVTEGKVALEAVNGVLAEDPLDLATRARRVELLRELGSKEEADREAALTLEILEASGDSSGEDSWIRHRLQPK